MKASVREGSSLCTLPIARGFTHLSTVYVTFWDGAGKWVNRFFCPMAGEPNTYVTDNVEWKITNGSERWPSFNCESVQETAHRLRLATAAHLGTDVFCITWERYRTRKFITGQSFEKTQGQVHIPESTPAAAPDCL